MNAAELKSFCLTMPGSQETFPFGAETSVFKVRNKVFALAPLGSTDLSVSLKCDPDFAANLRATHPAITPGYHLNKKHWNTIAIDGSIPDDMLRDLIRDSYDLVVSSLPGKVRADLNDDA